MLDRLMNDRSDRLPHYLTHSAGRSDGMGLALTALAQSRRLDGSGFPGVVRRPARRTSIRRPDSGSGPERQRARNDPDDAVREP